MLIIRILKENLSQKLNVKRNHVGIHTKAKIPYHPVSRFANSVCKEPDSKYFTQLLSSAIVKGQKPHTLYK